MAWRSFGLPALSRYLPSRIETAVTSSPAPVMSAHPLGARDTGKRSGLWELAGAVVFGIFVFATLPAGVVVMNDDFGYLRSVLATLQHGRPWTDDWLEPWSAGLSVMSAIVYLATGSWQLAIQGVQALLAGAGFWAATRLLRDRGLSTGAAAVLALLLLTTPTIFWKTLEYTSMVLSLPALLLALLAAERRRWGLFLLAWGLAIVTRQSAVAWGMLPLGAVICPRAGEARPWRPAIVVIAGGLLIYLAAVIGMNKTFAQSAVTDQMWQVLQFGRALELAAIGLMLLGGAAGIGAVIAGAPLRRAPAWAWLVAVPLVAWLAWGVEWHDRIQFEHGHLRQPIGIDYLRALLMLGAAGWLLTGFRMRREVVLTALAALALVCLRKDVWDYYYLDVIVCGLFGVSVGQREPRVQHGAKWKQLVFWAGATAALVTHACFVAAFKVSCDRQWAQNVLAESAMRSGQVPSSTVRGMPCGFIGWKLHPLSLERQADGSVVARSFWDYVDGSSLELRCRPVGATWLDPHGDAPPGATDLVVAKKRLRFCWWSVADHDLVLRPDPEHRTPVRSLDGKAVPMLPLDDEEWDALIQSQRSGPR